MPTLIKAMTEERRLTAREAQLTLFGNLALLTLLLTSMLSNFATTRMVKGDETVTVHVGNTPIRFLGFAMTLAFFVMCLISKGRLAKRELYVGIFLVFTQLFCNRLADTTAVLTYQTAVIAGGILWYRLPLHPKVFAAMVWIFALGNIVATAAKPGWAFYKDIDGSFLPVGRLAACTNHPNELGSLAGLLALMVAINLRTWGWRFVWVCLMLLLVLSQSKTSIACYGIAYVCYRRDWRMAIWFPPALLITGVVYAALAGSGMVGGAFSLTGRTNLWSVLDGAVVRSPILGWGADGVHQATLYAKVGFDPGNHAHNAALQVLVQGGALGLLCYGGFLICMRRTANNTVLGSALLLYIYIHTISESYLPWTFPYLFIFAGSFTTAAMQKTLPMLRKRVVATPVAAEPVLAYN